jgi:hypothetical protein
MQSLNLSSDPIWLLANESGDTIRLSLPDILLFDAPLFHAPNFGFLASIQHELLASILQVAVDSIHPKGICKKDYSRLICTEQSRELGTLIQEICDALGKLKGFALVGNGAFLQIPSAWGRSEKKDKIARLMWPFIPNIHGVEAKGLRRMSPIPMKIGPDLTALFIFSFCTLSKGGSQYWTSGNLSGRTLAHYHYGKTMRQQLFSAVLPGYSQHWKPLQTLPWIPDCLNNGGLEHNNRPPFWPYISGIKKLSGTANIRFFQSRAIVLDPPKLDQCDITGEKTLVFETFRILSETALHGKVRELYPANCGVQVSGIMGKMYAKTDHPSVLIQRSGDKKNSPVAITSLPYQGFSLPPWSIIRLVHRCPSHVIQSHDLITNSNKVAVKNQLNVFSLKYEAKKQDVRGVLQCHSDGTGMFNEDQLALILFLVEKSEYYIKAIRDGIGFLLSRDKDKNKAKSHQLPMETYPTNICQDIWNTADTIYHEFSTNNPQKAWGEKNVYRFKETIKSCWGRFLLDVWDDGSLSFQDRLKEYTAATILLGDGFMSVDFANFDAKPSVKAGRAFADEYYLLSINDKSQLNNNNEPYASRHFWRCMNIAKLEYSKAYQPLYENALPLLKFIIPVRNSTNIGTILSKYNKFISKKRIEIFFTTDDINVLIDSLKQFFSIIESKNRNNIPVDFGLLILDLDEFNFRPNMVMRRWATGYFSEQIHEEVDNVQA